MTGIGTGFFLTHRSLFNHEIWKNPLDFRLFLLIFGNAVFSDQLEYKGIIMKRGQWIRSFRQLQKDLEYIENQVTKQPSLSALKRSIDRLTWNTMITTLGTPLGTLFTVVNYAKYQGFQAIGVDTLEHPPKSAETVDNKGFEEGFQEKTLEQQTPEPWNKNNNVYINNNVLNNNVSQSINNKRVNLYDEFYLAYGRNPSAIQIDQIYQFSKLEGLTEELIAYAIQRSAERSGHFNYLTTVLKRLSDKGIKTVDQAEEVEQQRQKAREKGVNRIEKNIKIDHSKYDFGF